MNTESQNQASPATVRLDTLAQGELQWLVPGFIPRGQICLLAGEGGVGKSSIACDIASSISTGKPCALSPTAGNNTPGIVLMLNGEDSLELILGPKLARFGADLSRIHSVSDTWEQRRDIYIGSEAFERIVTELKPDLCIIDPIQSFLSPQINMSARNAIRYCMSTLMRLAQSNGTTFLVVCHTNKRSGVYARNRVADSSDLWDASRSVLLVGTTEEEGKRYISHEKCNYGALQDTIIFTLDDGLLQVLGTSTKKDCDFVQSKERFSKPSNTELCKQAFLRILQEHQGRCESAMLNEELVAEGYHLSAINSVRNGLKNTGQVTNRPEGPNHARKWITEIVTK